MKNFPFISQHHAISVFRIIVALLLVAHGAIRLYVGTVNAFGDFLDSSGFPAGRTIAWCLTLLEIIGGLTMAYGFGTRWIALLFIIELSMGIVLVHAKNGWFVVGHQSGGVEYSVLLIASLFTIAASARK